MPSESIQVFVKKMSGDIITLECPFDSHLHDLIPLIKLKLEEQGELIEQNCIHLFTLSDDDDDDEKKEENVFVEDMKMYGLFIMDPIPQDIYFPPHTFTGIICSKLAEWIGRQFTSINESEYRTGCYGRRLALPRLPRKITSHPQYMPPRILRQLPHIRAICQYARSRLVAHYWNWKLLSLHILYEQWLETIPQNTPIQTQNDHIRIFVELHINHFNWGLIGMSQDTFYYSRRS
jgi:hypothetical protein